MFRCCSSLPDGETPEHAKHHQQRSPKAGTPLSALTSYAAATKSHGRKNNERLANSFVYPPSEIYSAFRCDV